MRKSLLFIFILAISFGANAQFAQFWNNRTLFNPAFQNLEFEHMANATHRVFPSIDKVSTSGISYSAYFDGISGAIGVNYYNFRLANANSNVLNLAYNYQKSIGENTILSIGVGVGQAFAKIPPYFLNNQKTVRGNSLNMDAGIAAKWKNAQVGIGMKHLLQVDSINALFVPIQILNIMAQYTFGKETSIQVSPQIYYSSTNGFNDLMYNAAISYKNRYFIGLGGRNKDAVMASLGLLLWEKIRINYTYEYFATKLNNGVGNYYHEIGIGLQLGKR